MYLKKKVLNGTCILLILSFTSLLLRWAAYNPQNRQNVIQHEQGQALRFSGETSVNQCSPKTHIGFLKTHKSASCTVQNILFRYGWKHNLSFVLSEHSHEMLEDCTPFKSSQVSGTPWHHLGYDILAQHIIWDTNEIRKLLAKDSVYIQIIRDPVALVESMYGYAFMEEYYNMSLSQFAFKGKQTKYYKERLNCLGRNQIMFDFGLEMLHFDNDTAVKEKIKEADELFDLVMIAEYFEESVILLKDLLCWNMEDVTFFKQNFRKQEAIKTLTDEEKNGIREMNLADQMYYDHFLDKLKKKMREYGEGRLKKEIDQLKQKNKEIQDMCIKGLNNGEVHDARYEAYGNGAIGYLIEDNEKCVPYARNEPSFTALLRDIQIGRSKNRTNAGK